MIQVTGHPETSHTTLPYYNNLGAAPNPREARQLQVRPSVPTSTRTLPFATTAVRPHRRSDTQPGYPPKRSSTSKDTPPYPPSLTTAFSPGNLDSSSAEALKTHSQHFTTHSHTLRIGRKTPRGEIRHSRVHTLLTLHHTTLPRLGETHNKEVNRKHTK